MSPTYVFCIIFSYSVQNSDRMVLGRRSGGSLSRIHNAPSDNVCGVAKNRHGHNRYHESCSRCGSSDLDRKDRQTDVRPTSALLIWTNGIHHDDVIERNHFPRYWNFVRGNHRSPVHSPHKGHWHGALIFSLICAPTNGWANKRGIGDLRRHRAHYNVTVMMLVRAAFKVIE